LGSSITVDTLSGKIKLKVKPETQNGTKIRLKGKHRRFIYYFPRKNRAD
jgi:DnaJ-class molecular chaperone